MTLKKMIDADKICADQLFLRNLRPIFIADCAQLGMDTGLKIANCELRSTVCVLPSCFHLRLC